MAAGIRHVFRTFCFDFAVAVFVCVCVHDFEKLMIMAYYDVETERIFQPEQILLNCVLKNSSNNLVLNEAAHQ